MNWYSLNLGEENRLENCFFADDADLPGWDWLTDFTSGQQIFEWDANSILRSTKLNNDGLPDDMLANVFHLPVFSQRLRDNLSRKRVGIDNIQYLPIRVAQSSGIEFQGFMIANVVTTIPALCREKSFLLSTNDNEIDQTTGQPKVTGVGKAALFASLLQGHDMIRVLEFLRPLFVSERFVNAFQDAGFTGATFSKVVTV
jgi:hypothetical protein